MWSPACSLSLTRGSWRGVCLHCRPVSGSRRRRGGVHAGPHRTTRRPACRHVPGDGWGPLTGHQRHVDCYRDQGKGGARCMFYFLRAHMSPCAQPCQQRLGTVAASSCVEPPQMLLSASHRCPAHASAWLPRSCRFCAKPIWEEWFRSRCGFAHRPGFGSYYGLSFDAAQLTSATYALTALASAATGCGHSPGEGSGRIA